jgi:spermidine synthase
MSRLLVPIAVFFSAAGSLGVELAIVRLGAPYVGQSLLPWSAAIASVLLGLTAGHVLGGIAAAAAATLRQSRIGLAIVWLLAGLAAAVMLPALQIVIEAMPAGQGFGTGAVLAIAALACPPSLAAGFVAPMAIRVAVLMPDTRLPRMVGAIYAASAAGSVLGTAAAGFVLLERIGASGLVSVISGVWIALGIAALPWRTFSAAQAAGGAAATVAAVLTVVLLATPGPCLQESRYTCIRLFDRELAGGNVLRFMILDEGVHSATDRDHPRRLHLGYAALADRLARVAFARFVAPQALAIGGGGATLPRAWAAAPAQAAVTSIELDPAVAAVADDAMWAGRHAALTTMIGDGRAVVRALPSRETFAVVLMDAYRTHSVPPYLVTREFGEMIAARMTVQGVFLSNVIDRAGTPLLALSIARTLAQIFPAVDVWMPEGDVGEITNYVVAAWKDGVSAHRPDFATVQASVMEAGEAVRARDVAWRRVDAAAADRVWPHACVTVLTDDRAPVDRLLAGWAPLHCDGPTASR